MTKTDSISPFLHWPKKNAKRTLSLMSRPRHSSPHFPFRPRFSGTAEESGGGTWTAQCANRTGRRPMSKQKIQNAIVTIKGRAKIVALPRLHPRVPSTHALLTKRNQEKRERERTHKKTNRHKRQQCCQPAKTPRNSKEQSPAVRGP